MHDTRGPMGETEGVNKPEGEDLSGNMGLMLPRLWSRKRPLGTGLDESWPCNGGNTHHLFTAALSPLNKESSTH